MSCGCSRCSSTVSTCASSRCNSCTCEECTAICTALEVANSWNVPVCSGEAVLSFPGLTTVLIGAYLYNPTYGQFRIVGFNSTNGEVTVTNDCFPDNAPAGTTVPALTTFIYAAVPTLIGADGWVAADETWTYGSATTISIPAGGADKYEKGMKIGLVQSATQKFFSIVDVADTLLTITGGTDYTLTSNTITNPVYSSADSPVDFPPYFNYAGAPTGFSVVPAGALYSFRVFSGGWVSVNCRQPNNGTSNATSFTLAAPVTAKTLTDGDWAMCWSSGVDNGSSLAAPGRVQIASGGTTITINKTVDPGSTWTAANGKQVNFTNFVYPI